MPDMSMKMGGGERPAAPGRTAADGGVGPIFVIAQNKNIDFTTETQRTQRKTKRIEKDHELHKTGFSEATLACHPCFLLPFLSPLLIPAPFLSFPRRACPRPRSGTGIH